MDIISHYALLLERPVKLEDFSGFELVNLIHNWGWNKLIEWPYPVYKGLVQESYATSMVKLTPRDQSIYIRLGCEANGSCSRLRPSMIIISYLGTI